MAPIGADDFLVGGALKKAAGTCNKFEKMQLAKAVLENEAARLISPVAAAAALLSRLHPAQVEDAVGIHILPSPAAPPASSTAVASQPRRLAAATHRLLVVS